MDAALSFYCTTRPTRGHNAHTIFKMCHSLISDARMCILVTGTQGTCRLRRWAIIYYYLAIATSPGDFK